MNVKLKDWSQIKNFPTELKSGDKIEFQIVLATKIRTPGGIYVLDKRYGQSDTKVAII